MSPPKKARHVAPPNLQLAVNGQREALNNALGNLGGPLKSWMHPPTAPGTEPIPARPAQKRIKKTRPRPAPASPLQPEEQRSTSNSSSMSRRASEESPHTLPARSSPLTPSLVPPAPSTGCAVTSPRQSHRRASFMPGSNREQPELNAPMLPVAATESAPLPPVPSQLLTQNSPHIINTPGVREMRPALQPPGHTSSGPSNTVVPPNHTPPQPGVPSTTLPPGPQVPHAPISPFSSAGCEAQLTAFRARLPASLTLTPPHQQRLDVLQAAVHHNDVVFVMVHQIYCLMAVDPTQLPQSIASHPSLGFFKGMMDDMMGTNDVLHPGVREFFAHFPMRTQALANQFPFYYAAQERRLLSLIEHSPKYRSQMTQWVDRRLPPISLELILFLGITSSRLQQIAFRMAVRHINIRLQQTGVPPSVLLSLEQKAVEIHIRDVCTLAARMGVEPNILTDAAARQPYIDEVNRAGSARELRDLYSSCQPQVQPQMPRPLVQRPQGTAPATLPSQPPLQRGQPSNIHHPGRPSTAQTNSSQAPTVRTSLLPPAGTVLSVQRQANPACFALHEADLRDATLRAEPSGSVLYQYFDGFIHGPTRLPEALTGVETWSFDVSPDIWQRIPKRVVPDGNRGEPDEYQISTSNFMLRLRCVKSLSDFTLLHVWAVADTAWIPAGFYHFNEKPLQPRRKIHYGKDLPIDLTALVQEGSNELKVAVLRDQADNRYRNYLLAIEMIRFAAEEEIVEMCLKNTRPAAEVLQAIKSKISGTSFSRADDDDITMMQANLTINLLDPFAMSTICEIPVRSKVCLHNDCFDLVTFLHSRKKQGEVSVADMWRCPICNADARPNKLLVDGFLQLVREELTKRNLLNTRAIVVDQDGNWEPKMVPLGSATPDVEVPVSTPVVTNGLPAGGGGEIIELD